MATRGMSEGCSYPIGTWAVTLIRIGRVESKLIGRIGRVGRIGKIGRVGRVGRIGRVGRVESKLIGRQG